MGMIHIRDLRVSFDGVPLLRGVTLNVEKGSTVAILGTSGAGKSVLLKSIVGLVRPQGGSVLVDGNDLAGMDPERLRAMRRRMGYLFQGAALYDSMSVRENLAFALRSRGPLADEEIDARVKEQLQRVGLQGAIDKMPYQLSGGMRKRVGLARALITRPDIMLYDEPTTGLDPLTGRDISCLIRDLDERHEMTSLAVTHDMACTRIIADRVAILNNGIILAEGTLETLVDSDDDFVKRFMSAA
jgi:phospholipid/cholesterol/gamma-HCH transport system ATP-binding protein